MRALNLGLAFISGVCLFLPARGSADDTSALESKPANLEKQIGQLNEVIDKLESCVSSTNFDSKKDLCRRALSVRKQQRAMAQEKLELLQLLEDPSMLPKELKNEADKKIAELDGDFATAKVPPAEPRPATTPPPAATETASGSQEKPTSEAGAAAKRVAAQKMLRQSSGAPGGDMLRTIVGFEQAGASSAASQQSYFFDILYSRPVNFKCWGWKQGCGSKGRILSSSTDLDLGPRWRSWGNLRISSVPVSVNTPLAEFATNFAGQVGQLPVNRVAQAFEFLGGVEARLAESPKVYRGFDGKTSQVFTLNLLVSGGVITPLSPQQSVQLFKVPTNQPGFFTAFPQAQGKQLVAFVLPDRDRFFRQAYAGLRVASNYIEDNEQFPKRRFPATFDITYGFNESVTGGRIRGGVMRLDGFLPIPYSDVSWIYLFGTGLFKPGTRASIQSPFLLDPAPTGSSATDPTAVVISTPQANRDYYRIGFGIDFIDLVKTLQASKNQKKLEAEAQAKNQGNQPK